MTKNSLQWLVNRYSKIRWSVWSVEPTEIQTNAKLQLFNQTFLRVFATTGHLRLPCPSQPRPVWLFWLGTAWEYRVESSSGAATAWQIVNISNKHRSLLDAEMNREKRTMEHSWCLSLSLTEVAGIMDLVTVSFTDISSTSLSMDKSSCAPNCSHLFISEEKSKQACLPSITRKPERTKGEEEKHQQQRIDRSSCLSFGFFENIPTRKCDQL